MNSNVSNVKLSNIDRAMVGIATGLVIFAVTAMFSSQAAWRQTVVSNSTDIAVIKEGMKALADIKEDVKSIRNTMQAQALLDSRNHK